MCWPARTALQARSRKGHFLSGNRISPRLGIRFDPGEGSDNLRIFRPDGARFLTFDELGEKSMAEERRADSEGQRADEERQRADEQA